MYVLYRLEKARSLLRYILLCNKALVFSQDESFARTVRPARVFSHMANMQ